MTDTTRIVGLSHELAMTAADDGATTDRNELNDLIDVAARMTRACPEPLTDHARAQMRVRLMNLATAELRPQRRATRFPWTRTVAPQLRRAAAVTATVVGMLGTTIGSITASAAADPADLLYPVKLAGEQVAITFAPSDHLRANAYAVQAAHRLSEAERVLASGGNDRVDVLLTDAAHAIEQSQRLSNDHASVIVREQARLIVLEQAARPVSSEPRIPVMTAPATPPASVVIPESTREPVAPALQGAVSETSMPPAKNRTTSSTSTEAGRRAPTQSTRATDGSDATSPAGLRGVASETTVTLSAGTSASDHPAHLPVSVSDRAGTAQQEPGTAPAPSLRASHDDQTTSSPRLTAERHDGQPDHGPAEVAPPRVAADERQSVRTSDERDERSAASERQAAPGAHRTSEIEAVKPQQRSTVPEDRMRAQPDASNQPAAQTQQNLVPGASHALRLDAPSGKVTATSAHRDGGATSALPGAHEIAGTASTAAATGPAQTPRAKGDKTGTVAGHRSGNDVQTGTGATQEKR